MSNQLTEVHLLSVPLQKDYKDTFYFENQREQSQYFLSLPKKSASNLSYQGKESYLRFPAHVDDIINYNYLMFRNNEQSKWYYAFITRMEYKNDEVTWIYFDIDVIQSYLRNYTIKESFVEREHAERDNVGDHTLPENLECGDFVVEMSLKATDLSKLCIVIGITSDKDGNAMDGERYNGLYSGVRYDVFYADQVGMINDYIKLFPKEGRAEAIVCMFVCPEFLAKPTQNADKTWDIRVFGSEAPKTFDFSFTKPFAHFSPIGDYTPRNAKLYTFPYKSLLVSNNNGGSAVYKYEDFGSDDVDFKISGVLTPGCSVRLAPMNYRGMDENEEEGLNLGKYPICNWTSDVYTNWLTQNSVNIGLNIASGVGQIIAGASIAMSSGGLATAVGGGSVVGGVSTITNQLAQIHQMSFTPPQSNGNINCGDVVTATNNNTFTFYSLTIKPEYARIIDKYFDMFGYKTSLVKIPASNHRESYWYTKTIDVNIVGKSADGVPQEYLEKIKACYNNGIRFWKNKSEFGNFSVSNDTYL